MKHRSELLSCWFLCEWVKLLLLFQVTRIFCGPFIIPACRASGRRGLEKHIGILYACFIILKPSESLGAAKEKFLGCHLLFLAVLWYRWAAALAAHSFEMLWWECKLPGKCDIYTFTATATVTATTSAAARPTGKDTGEKNLSKKLNIKIPKILKTFQWDSE